MRLKSLVAEILSGIRKYDDLGQIDYRTLDLILRNELKRFGSNVMERRSKVLEVINGKARLPENFSRLRSAIRCDVMKVVPEIEIDDQWRMDAYTARRTENTYEWDNATETHFKQSYKEIYESKLVRGSRIKFIYNPYEILSLKKGFNRDLTTSDCINKNISKIKGSGEINITADYIYTNFEEGDIYIIYEGLQEDEDGEIIVPDYSNLIDYLIATASYKLLRGLVINDEAKNLVSVLNLLKQESDSAYIKATTQVKMENLDPNWSKDFRKRQAKYLRKFYGPN